MQPGIPSSGWPHGHICIQQTCNRAVWLGPPVAAQVQRSECRQVGQAGWQILDVIVAQKQFHESAAAADAVWYGGHLVAAGVQER